MTQASGGLSASSELPPSQTESFHLEGFSVQPSFPHYPVHDPGGYKENVFSFHILEKEDPEPRQRTLCRVTALGPSWDLTLAGLHTSVTLRRVSQHPTPHWGCTSVLTRALLESDACALLTPWPDESGSQCLVQGWESSRSPASSVGY